MSVLELSTNIVASTARAAARRELRIVKEVLAGPAPLALWSAYDAHHEYLQRFLGVLSTPCLGYVTDRFMRICTKGMPDEATFLAEAERAIQLLILENTK